jgi:multiple sugar transport system permease protein
MATQFARPVEKNNVAAYAFLAPALLFFLLFQVLPIIGTLLLSIHSGGILSGFKFNGFSNYSEVFHSREILQCLEFTVTYVVLIIPTVIGFSLFIAVLLTDRFLGARNFFKTLVFFPGLAPMVTLATLWRFMIDPDIGLLNIIISWLGLTPPNWLAHPSSALAVIILIELWRGTGFYLITFMAGLLAIPEELYEAAEIDGAGSLRQFWSITLPMLRPTLLFALVVATIFNLQIFDSVYVLTSGGPGGSTQSVAWYIFSNAFKYDRLGAASAIATVFMVVIFALTLAQFRLLRSDD